MERKETKKDRTEGLHAKSQLQILSHELIYLSAYYKSIPVLNFQWFGVGFFFKKNLTFRTQLDNQQNKRKVVKRSKFWQKLLNNSATLAKNYGSKHRPSLTYDLTGIVIGHCYFLTSANQVDYLVGFGFHLSKSHVSKTGVGSFPPPLPAPYHGPFIECSHTHKNKIKHKPHKRVGKATI